MPVHGRVPVSGGATERGAEHCTTHDMGGASFFLLSVDKDALAHVAKRGLDAARRSVRRGGVPLAA